VESRALLEITIWPRCGQVPPNERDAALVQRRAIARLQFFDSACAGKPHLPPLLPFLGMATARWQKDGGGRFGPRSVRAQRPSPNGFRHRGTLAGPFFFFFFLSSDQIGLACLACLAFALASEARFQRQQRRHTRAACKSGHGGKSNRAYGESIDKALPQELDRRCDIVRATQWGERAMGVATNFVERIGRLTSYIERCTNHRAIRS